MAAAAYLASETIQHEITTIFSHGQASNLDAERMVAQTRHQEHHKVISLASASRNMILSRSLGRSIGCHGTPGMGAKQCLVVGCVCILQTFHMLYTLKIF